jgi:hypothetical protein
MMAAMPHARSHEGWLLVGALVLASAGIAMSLTAGGDVAPKSSPRRLAAPTSSTAVTTLPTTTSTTAPPRIWSAVDNCAAAEPDRPAILSYAINSAKGVVPLKQAARMARAAGIPTANLMRQGDDWYGYAEATGTVGTLIGPAHKLLAARTDQLWTSAQLVCAGHKHNTDQIWVLLRGAAADPGELARRHGFVDVVSQVTDRSGSRTTAYLTTFAPLSVEHVIEYLSDDDVLAALPSSDCALGVAAGAADIPKNLLNPSSSTTAPTTSTSTTVRYVPAPQHDYSSYACGTEVA